MQALHSTLLLVARELILRTSHTRRITRAGLGGENYFSFSVSSGRGRDKTLYMPFINRTTRASVLSLLESTNARTVRWLFNGQAHTGTRSIIHFGDSGACHIVFSRTVREELLRALYAEHYEKVMETSEWWRAELAHAPAQSQLFFRTANDQDEVITLPPEAVSVPIYKALRGEVQLIDAGQRAAIDEIIDKGMRLVTVRAEGGAFSLGRPADLDLPTLLAAA